MQAEPLHPRQKSVPSRTKHYRALGARRRGSVGQTWRFRGPEVGREKSVSLGLELLGNAFVRIRGDIFALVWGAIFYFSMVQQCIGQKILLRCMTAALWLWVVNLWWDRGVEVSRLPGRHVGGCWVDWRLKSIGPMSTVYFLCGLQTGHTHSLKLLRWSLGTAHLGLKTARLIREMLMWAGNRQLF